MSNPLKYYKTQGELIDHYVPNEDNQPYVVLYADKFSQALIHAYELGAMHHSEEDGVYNRGEFELAEFDSNWEQENN